MKYKKILLFLILILAFIFMQHSESWRSVMACLTVMTLSGIGLINE